MSIWKRDWAFYDDRILFLERMIEQHPENKDFLQAYTKLIEKEIELEIKQLEYDEKIHKNNTDFNKARDSNDTEYHIQILKESPKNKYLPE